VPKHLIFSLVKLCIFRGILLENNGIYRQNKFTDVIPIDYTSFPGYHVPIFKLAQSEKVKKKRSSHNLGYHDDDEASDGKHGKSKDDNESKIKLPKSPFKFKKSKDDSHSKHSPSEKRKSETKKSH